MKVLIVSTWDNKGGAAKSAYRLFESLTENSIDCKMLVLDKGLDHENIIGPVTKLSKALAKFSSKFERIPSVFYKSRSKTPFSSGFIPFSNTIKLINELEFDIVHFHWVCSGFINVADIAKINVPVVWSLLDMWSFTGGCHYDEYCGRFESNCGKCKVLGSHRENDLSSINQIIKKKAYEKSNMTIVGHSKWLSDCAKKSSVLKEKRVLNIGSPIDARVFKGLNKKKSRELWGLPKDKKLVLFGAVNATEDPRKGYVELMGAVNNLNVDVEFVVFGSSKPLNDTIHRKFNFHYLGEVKDDASLVALYNSVDVTVVPSLQENLSNVILESLSCETPVVAFDIGGNSDMIQHMVNGYLAKPFSEADLASGISWVVNNPNQELLSKKSRQMILDFFDYPKLAPKYIKLYKEILN